MNIDSVSACMIAWKHGPVLRAAVELVKPGRVQGNFVSVAETEQQRKEGVA